MIAIQILEEEMNILEKELSEREGRDIFDEYTEELSIKISTMITLYGKMNSLPTNVSKEDINKLQRYDFKDETPDYAEMLETDNGEYIRYDDIISLLTK